MRSSLFRLISGALALSLIAASAIAQDGSGRRRGGEGGGERSSSGRSSRGDQSVRGGSDRSYSGSTRGNRTTGGSGEVSGRSSGSSWRGNSRGGSSSYFFAQEGTGRRRGGGGSESGGGGGGNSGGGNRPPRNDPGPRTDSGSRGNSGNSNGGGGDSGGGGYSGGGGQSGNGGDSGRPGRGNSVIISGGQDTATARGGRRGPSRSGVVNYGTVSNATNRRDRVTAGRAPAHVQDVLGRRVNQSERIRAVRPWGGFYDGIRVGYYHYNRRWRDDFWCYPFYVFDPWADNACVVSPWYYYPCLPPYVSRSRIIIVNTFPAYWYGVPYTWHPYRRDAGDDASYRDRTDLDYAVDDIVSSFENDDRRAMSRLVPRRGDVNVYVDSDYRYSLAPDDFYDMFRDGIDSTKTDHYDITDIKWNGRDAARVYARHDYIDPWDQQATVYHRYYLEREGRDFVIREFSTSNDPYRD